MSEGKLAERYGLAPVFMESLLDGSTTIAVRWDAVLPLLARLAELEGDA